MFKFKWISSIAIALASTKAFAFLGIEKSSIIKVSKENIRSSNIISTSFFSLLEKNECANIWENEDDFSVDVSDCSLHEFDSNIIILSAGNEQDGSGGPKIL